MQRSHAVPVASILRQTLGAAVLAVLAGCGAASSVEVAPGAPPTTDTRTGEAPRIEESDLYRHDGSWLYVQNPQTGLNVLDLSTPAAPRLVGRAAVVGAAGELYVRKGHAIVLLKSPTAACRLPARCNAGGWRAGAEVAMVDVTDAARPRVVDRYCIPGQLVASRVVNDTLFLVTNQSSGGSRAYALDIADPAQAAVRQQLDFPSASKEILVTGEAIVVAGPAKAAATNCPAGLRCASAPQTEVQYVQLVAETGEMIPRGRLAVPGEPQGRFHMDLYGHLFRVVTYDPLSRSSRLSVIDVSAPDSLRLVGRLDRLGPGERLYATRFAGETAYVVTYRQTDPLWVISLREPARPRLVGELHVPGWSDFIFPYGERLLCVGRGDRGVGLQVSLFDVSDPTEPRTVDQVQLGGSGTTSEANLDHRAVSLLERDGELPLIVVPYATRATGSCGSQSYVQVIDVLGSGLRLRGRAGQRGPVRRTFRVEESLLSVSDYEVLSLDLRDRDALPLQGTVVVGNQLSAGAMASSCNALSDDWNDAPPSDTTLPEWQARKGASSRMRYGCEVGGSVDELPRGLPFLLIALALLIWHRGSRRSRGGRTS